MERYYTRCVSAGRKWKICVCNREIFGFDGQSCISSAASLAEDSIQRLLYEIFLRPRDLRSTFTIAMAWGFLLMNFTSWEVEQPRVFAAAAGLKSSNFRKSSASARNAGKSGCLWLTSIFLANYPGGNVCYYDRGFNFVSMLPAWPAPPGTFHRAIFEQR